jgi:phage head maturation protease
MGKLIEYKALDLELSDMDRERRTAIISHAVYDVIDRFGDISRKGMFNKSWSERKAGNIRFDIDHDAGQQPGRVISVFENEKKAFTQVKFGSHTLGNDTMLMMDEGIIRGASFEFVTEKKAEINIKGKRVRELKEVKHIATTVTLTIPPVNPLAMVESVTKAGHINVSELKARIANMERFCRNTNASDDCIKNLLEEITEVKSIISTHDTADTQQATEPDASVKEFGDALNLRMKVRMLRV